MKAHEVEKCLGTHSCLMLRLLSLLEKLSNTGDRCEAGLNEDGPANGERAPGPPAR
jgi:hypothetical protein